MTHQSPSPLCEVDKSSLADRPGQRELGTGQEDPESCDGAGGVYELRSNLYNKQWLLKHIRLYSGSLNTNRYKKG